MISVPYDSSSIEYEINPIGDANQRVKVRQEGVHRDVHHSERSLTMIPDVPVTEMYGCPKVSNSPSRKKKGFPQGSVDVYKENQPAKVARHAQALVVRPENIRDTGEDLEMQPVQVKRSTPRKPFGSSLERSNSSVDVPTKAHHGKLWYDPVTAMKLRQERQDIPGIKRDLHTCAKSLGC